MITKATINMTDKQILVECRPKPLYYSTTYGRHQARPCILCGTTILGKFDDLEAHVRDTDIPAYQEQYTQRT